MRLLTFLARRFVAGDTAADAVQAVRKLNEKGLKCTLDCLGEECRAPDQAAGAVEEYGRILSRIAEAGLDSNVSLKLTQLGLAFDPKLARDNLLRVLDRADQYRNFVRVDMEGSAYTQKTLDLFYEVFRARSNVGPVIQAYLRRSRSDVEALIQAGARVRLCKGAYKEPASLAFPSKDEVNASFDSLARELLVRGAYPGIATHDEERIQAAVRFAEEKGVGKDRFEFQMLYGIRGRRASALRAQGYNVRVYVPYGTHWFPYFVRRLRERKENLLFVLRNLVEA